MNKKTWCIVVVTIVAIFLSGCGQLGVNDDEPTRTANYRVGTKGLTLNVLNAPDRIYEGDQIQMIIEVANEGAYPQPIPGSKLETEFEAYMWFGGYDPNILYITDESDINDIAGKAKTVSERDTDNILGPRPKDSGADPDTDPKDNRFLQLHEDTGTLLEGKNPLNVDGGFKSILVNLNAEIGSLPDATPSYPTPILIDLTYRYKTLASPMICIDPQPGSTSVREKVCDVDRYTVVTTGSQGAPVAVSRVETEAKPGNLLVRIFVDNVGGGRVIPLDESKGTFDFHDDPNAGYRYSSLNKVKIKKVEISGIPDVTCTPGQGDGEIDIDRGRGYILCRFDLTGLGNRVYETPLNIELEYAYQTSIRKDVEVLEDILNS